MLSVGGYALSTYIHVRRKLFLVGLMDERRKGDTRYYVYSDLCIVFGLEKARDVTS